VANARGGVVSRRWKCFAHRRHCLGPGPAFPPGGQAPVALARPGSSTVGGPLLWGGVPKLEHRPPSSRPGTGVYISRCRLLSSPPLTATTAAFTPRSPMLFPGSRCSPTRLHFHAETGPMSTDLHQNSRHNVCSREEDRHSPPAGDGRPIRDTPLQTRGECHRWLDNGIPTAAGGTTETPPGQQQRPHDLITRESTDAAEQTTNQEPPDRSTIQQNMTEDQRPRANAAHVTGPM
jgi:hypothetical protein